MAAGGFGLFVFGFGDLRFLSLGLILWLSCWFVDGAGSFLGMVCRFFDFLDFGVGAIYLFTLRVWLWVLLDGCGFGLISLRFL